MLKKLHLKLVLLLTAMIMGAGNVWAADTETTYTFTSKAWESSNGDWTSGKEGNALTSGRGIQVTKGVSGANATSPISFSNISKIVVTYSTNASDGAGAIKFKVGNGTEQFQYVTKTGGTTDRTLTYNFSPAETGKVKITVDCTTNSIYVKSVTITYTADGGSGNVDTPSEEVESYKYSLFSDDLVEGDYIIYYDGKAMNTTVTNNRLKYEEVTPVENIITTNNSAIVWHIAPSGDYWTIYNATKEEYAAANGTKNQAQMLSDGSDNKALWTVSSTSVSGTSYYEFVNKANAASNVNAYLRNNGTYGFACYSDGTGGALSLYKKMEETVTISAAGYATFCSDKALNFKGVAGLTAYQAVMMDDGKTVKFNPVDDVPAGTGVLVEGAKGAESTYKIPVVDGSTTDVSRNKLVGVTKAEDAVIGMSSDKGTHYVLKQIGENVGFYQVNNAAYKVRVNSAYLALTVSTGGTGAKDFIPVDGTTAIELVDTANEVAAPAYNLQGQRVGNDYKGVVIVNGKKVIR